MLLFITVHLINGSWVHIVSANSLQSLLSLPASCRQACYPSANKVSIILHTCQLVPLFFSLPQWQTSRLNSKDDRPKTSNESFKGRSIKVSLSLRGWDYFKCHCPECEMDCSVLGSIETVEGVDLPQWWICSLLVDVDRHSFSTKQYCTWFFNLVMPSCGLKLILKEEGVLNVSAN